MYKRKTNRISLCCICNKELINLFGHTKACSPECRRIHNCQYQVNRRRNSVTASLRSITAGCKNRAKRKNYPCDIDSAFVLDLYHKQNGRCAITNMELAASNSNTKHDMNPLTITIDRKDSTKGYTKDNIQLVTLMYNVCKNRWSHEQVIEFAKGVLASARL